MPAQDWCSWNGPSASTKHWNRNVIPRSEPVAMVENLEFSASREGLRVENVRYTRPRNNSRRAQSRVSRPVTDPASPAGTIEQVETNPGNAHPGNLVRHAAKAVRPRIDRASRVNMLGTGLGHTAFTHPVSTRRHPLS